MSASESQTDVDGLVIVPVPYVCRVCATEREVYVSPRVVDDELHLVDERHRVTVAPCEACGCDRTHVLAYALADRRAVAPEDVRADRAWQRPTPPVPPAEIERFDDPGLGSYVVDREAEDVDCPRCGGTLWLQERRTGERAIGFWPEIDDDRYRTSDEWPVVETEEVCDHCGWNRVLG